MYNSLVRTDAEQTGQEHQDMQFFTRCRANFEVQLVDTKGAFIKMVIDQVKTSITVGTTKEDAQHDADSEKSYEYPLYFTHKTDGSIDDVIASDDDDAEMVKVKSSILFALSTNLASNSEEASQKSIVDPQGLHYEFYTRSAQNGNVVVESYFTDNDFVAFTDEKMTVEMVVVDGKNRREVAGNKVVTSQSSMNFVMNRQSSQGNGVDGEIVFVTSGEQELSNLVQGVTLTDLAFPYKSIAEFLKKNPKMKYVPTLQRSYFEKRKPVKTVVDQAPSFNFACPGDIDFCKGFEHSWDIGNANVGMRISVSAVAGVKTGCSSTSRSYLVGAYANLDIIVVGNTLPAVVAYAEYGQVGGVPSRNGIEILIFGYSLYKYPFPWINCIENTIPVVHLSKDFTFTYSTMVYVVKLDFSIGVTLGFDADIKYSLCPQDIKASITFVPTATAILHGGASASVAVARAGIEISGKVKDFVDPIAYIDGNICRVGFAMYNNLEPITAKLVGYFEIRTIKFNKLIPKITWGPRHELVLWSHTWPGLKTKIIDIYYGAK
jgi:hypothetical protein